MAKYTKKLAMFALLLMSGNVLAAQSSEREGLVNSFALYLGATRVIYNLESRGATLTVSNEQEYPILVQSEIMSEEQKKNEDFVVSPPLFRLDASQSSRIRIVRAGGTFPQDRESLRWLCVRGIPPKDNEQWAGKQSSTKTSGLTMKVQFAVSNCIKLIVRPESLNGGLENAAAKISWRKDGGKLIANNPTPYYMNISEVIVGGKKLNESHYVAPYSTQDYKLASGVEGDVKWSIVTDYGGISKLYSARLNQK